MHTCPSGHAGLSLIELLIALVVLSIMAAGFTHFWLQAQRDLRLMEETALIHQTGLNLSLLLQQDLVPAALLTELSHSEPHCPHTDPVQHLWCHAWLQLHQLTADLSGLPQSFSLSWQSPMGEREQVFYLRL